jgi:WD40 repeat protein
MTKLEHIITVEKPVKETYSELDSFYLQDFAFANQDNLAFLGDKTMGFFEVDYDKKESKLILLSGSGGDLYPKLGVNAIATRPSQKNQVTLYTGCLNGNVEQQFRGYNSYDDGTKDYHFDTTFGVMYNWIKDISHMEFSLDGNLLAVASEDGTVMTFKTIGEDGYSLDVEKIHTWNYDHHSVRGISLSPDGILATSTRRDVRFGSVDGEEIQIPKENSDFYHINDIAFSPDGNLFAVLGLLGNMNLYRFNPKEGLEKEAKLEFSFPIPEKVKFSPDGKYIGVMSKAAIDIYEVKDE